MEMIVMMMNDNYGDDADDDDEWHAGIENYTPNEMDFFTEKNTCGRCENSFQKETASPKIWT